MLDDRLMNFSNIDLPIYRVIRLGNLFELFKTGNLVLTRPHEWDDPFENCLLKSKVVQKSTGVEISIREIIDIFFGLCWTLNSKETDATWRIYAPKKKREKCEKCGEKCERVVGVRIATTVRKLLSSLNLHEDLSKNKLFYVGKVRYLESKTIISNVTSYIKNKHIVSPNSVKLLMRLLLLKRKEFSHEKEVRLLFSDPSKTIKDYMPQCSFSINPYDLIDEIVIDPRIPDIHYECYRDELIKLDHRVKKIPICQSQLYQFPPVRIVIDI